MSCCQACKNNMRGSAWGGLYGLGDGILAAGSFIRVGFKVRETLFDKTSDGDWTTAKIMFCLFDGGLFDTVDATWAAGYLSQYITVTARTVIDFGSADDAAGNIQETIKQCLPELNILQRDAIVIDSIPETAANVPSVQQPNYKKYEQQYKGNQNNANKPKRDCWNETSSWTDYAACELNVTPTGAGVAGAVVGVGLLLLVASLVRK